MRTFTRAQAKEFQRMNNPKIDTWQKATVVKAINGSYAKFRVGEAVLVRRTGPRKRTFTVERATWRGSMVPLCNSIILVPSSKLKLT